MRFIFRFGLILIVLNSSISAIIVETEEELTDAQKKAETLKGDIQPGLIWSFDSKGDRVLDPTSAIAIGMPGQKETKTVLSCAHGYFSSLSTHNEAKFSFIDVENKSHQIEKVLPLVPNSYDVKVFNDVCLFFLDHAIPCNPKLVISPVESTSIELTTITYGWTLNTQTLDVSNNSWVLPYSFTTTFENEHNVWIHQYESIRIGQLVKGKGVVKKPFYLAKPKSSPQLFLQDSGSPWFSKTQTGYNLVGITREISSLAPLDQQNLLGNKLAHVQEADYKWFNEDIHLDIYDLDHTTLYKNRLTPLHRHVEWIYGNCK